MTAHVAEKPPEPPKGVRVLHLDRRVEQAWLDGDPEPDSAVCSLMQYEPLLMLAPAAIGLSHRAATGEPVHFWVRPKRCAPPVAGAVRSAGASPGANPMPTG